MLSRTISIVTLGVADLSRSSRFYEGLGFRRSGRSDQSIVWFATAGTVLALYPWDALADDATLPPQHSGFPGITLAINLASEVEVDELVRLAQSLGARVIKEPQRVFWGGYSSYFQDPDGHLWEAAHNPFTTVDSNGTLDLKE